MAKRKPAVKPNRDLEAHAALIGAVGFFLLAPLFLPTALFGAFLRENFYGFLGLPAYLLPSSLFLISYALLRHRPLKPLLRHLLLAHLLALTLTPLLPLGSLGLGLRRALEAQAGVLGLLLPSSSPAWYWTSG
jgi:S-DNA-T family DNA segregation ATPase FtsK/SpoIIIE